MPPFEPGRFAADRARVFARFHVSRETAARLDLFVCHLLEWQQKINLVAPSTLPSLWIRHIADSLQLLDIAGRLTRVAEAASGVTPGPARPESLIDTLATSQPNVAKTDVPAREQRSIRQRLTWVDLGSGAGFPGLVIACAIAQTNGACVHLVESHGKKAAFLREAIRKTGAAAIVHAMRIETVAPQLAVIADVVTARALAPLADLLPLVFPFVQNGAQVLLPKGQDVEAELTAATKYWNIDVEIVPSQTSSKGQILALRGLSRRASE
jgi:16S rRNA (guanine527-N7)-methyltransferase